MKLKNLPSIERPREKLLRYGVDRLSDLELIAVLLSTGTKSEDVLQLSSRIIRVIQKDSSVLSSAKQFQELTHIGQVKSCTLVASLELGRRILLNKKSLLIFSPEDVWRQLQDIREQRKEHFVVFYLDIRNQIIKRDIISIGTLNTSIVHPREVFEPAIRDGAAQIIISHNHPSGVVEPSEEDIKLTKRLINAGEILGIEIIDHIIVSKKSYLSFKEKKLI